MNTLQLIQEYLQDNGVPSDYSDDIISELFIDHNRTFIDLYLNGNDITISNWDDERDFNISLADPTALEQILQTIQQILELKQ